MNYFVHQLADVQNQVIGDGTRMLQYVVVLLGARVGADVKICSYCFVQNDVIIGDRVAAGQH